MKGFKVSLEVGLFGVGHGCLIARETTITNVGVDCMNSSGRSSKLLEDSHLPVLIFSVIATEDDTTLILTKGRGLPMLNGGDGHQFAQTKGLTLGPGLGSPQ